MCFFILQVTTMGTKQRTVIFAYNGRIKVMRIRYNWHRNIETFPSLHVLCNKAYKASPYGICTYLHKLFHFCACSYLFAELRNIFFTAYQLPLLHYISLYLIRLLSSSISLCHVSDMLTNDIHEELSLLKCLWEQGVRQEVSQTCTVFQKPYSNFPHSQFLPD